jgi:hypothetical protein
VEVTLKLNKGPKGCPTMLEEHFFCLESNVEKDVKAGKSWLDVKEVIIKKL